MNAAEGKPHLLMKEATRPRKLSLKQPKKRYEALTQRLARMIKDGRIGSDGKMPSERSLREQFGVGRSTVREALFSLKKLGLISVRNGAVAQVTEPTPKTVIDELSTLAKLIIADDDGMRNFQGPARYSK